MPRPRMTPASRNARGRRMRRPYRGYGFRDVSRRAAHFARSGEACLALENLLNGLGKNYTICPVLRAEKAPKKSEHSLRMSGV